MIYLYKISNQKYQKFKHFLKLILSYTKKEHQYYCIIKMHKKGRINQLILGQKTVNKIKSVNILVVGIGGIGCQVVKNLSKSGYKRFTLLDLDRIEETNLNRQFYFRKAHIGQFKAEVVKKSILIIDSSLTVKAYNESIYHPRFNHQFYSQFDIIVSALDSVKVREYLAAQATKYGKPLVDAGTMSYFGQAESSVRFLTSCKNCTPSKNQEVLAICNIRRTPQLPVHCATFAKNFYDSFFGGNLGQALNDNLKFEKYFTESQSEYSDELLQTIAIQLFTQLFDEGIANTDLQGNQIDLIRKLPFAQAKSKDDIVENPIKSTFRQVDFIKQQKSKYNEEKLWSVKYYSEEFIQTMIKLMKRRIQNKQLFKFQKDDDECMTLINCITNLRTYNFINYHSIYNKHKYLTYYQCKDLIGKVMPAIASTNAIAAALELREMNNIVAGKLQKIRHISISNVSSERLSPAIQSQFDPQCDFCSEKVIYAKIVCDMQTTLFKDLQCFANQNLFTFNRDVSTGSLVIIRNSRKNATLVNKQKSLNFAKQHIHEGAMNLTFAAIPQNTDIIVHLAVIDKPGASTIQIVDTPSKSQLKLQLLNYYQRIECQKVEYMASEIKYYGGYQL